MDKRLLLTITIIIAVSGIFVYMQGEGGQEISETEEGEMDVPEMNSRYITMIAPQEQAKTPVRFRFDANTTQAEEYVILVDGEHAASGDLYEQNLEKLDLAEGTHTYTVQLVESGNTVDETSQRNLSVINGTRIELISPVGPVESGDEIEFVYSVNGSETAELFLDGEKIAEKETGDVNRITVQDIKSGEHVWSLEADEGSKEETFDVEEDVETLQIHDFDVVDSDEGWRARADVTALLDTQYTLYVDDEIVDEGLVPEGDVSLGIPVELNGEQAVKIRFRNEHGEFTTDEVSVDAG